jgi:hypothetical protein
MFPLKIITVTDLEPRLVVGDIDTTAKEMGVSSLFIKVSFGKCHRGNRNGGIL